MSPTKIEKLTPEQEALIPFYREKWRAIALSTEPIDRYKASAAVKAAYSAFGFKEPEIIFSDSPYTPLNKVLSQLRSELPQMQNELWSQLQNQMNSRLESQVSKQVWCELESHKLNQLGRRLENQLRRQLWRQQKLLSSHVGNYMQPIGWGFLSFYDYSVSVFHFDIDKTKWLGFQSLIKNCRGLLPYEDTCIVCDRPIQLFFDNENRLHAEGEPAIQFADGYSLYSYHGVTLPEKYGKLRPNQWQAKWLLEEDNAELRRALIQGIGYSRICQELQAIELNSWQEYTLLKIDAEVDEELIYLLKMTCPSTGFIHALRVPPDINSAREAINWLNWGTDPEEFSVQT